jgi:hypothetical protein
MFRIARVILVVVLVAAVGFAAFALTPPKGPRSMREFNPSRVADLELRMWQAYYAKDRATLFRLLVVLLREQYRYSWARATTQAFHLARAASTFAELRDHYDVVLPDLEAAYASVKSWSNAGFDPRAVAEAELAWWVARRVPGQNSAEQVGRLIAQEYALLYETSVERVAEAALLRATAGRLRDSQAPNADWARIGRLLQQSYQELLAAVSIANV